jgi:putative transposase
MRPKLLIHDRNGKFVTSFDDIFRSEGVRLGRHPFRAPRANAVCARWIGSLRPEALDWLLITGERHLRRVLVEYVEHYNLARPCWSLGLRAPMAEEDPGRPIGGVFCRSRLGGLLHEPGLEHRPNARSLRIEGGQDAAHPCHRPEERAPRRCCPMAR